MTLKCAHILCCH